MNQPTDLLPLLSLTFLYYWEFLFDMVVKTCSRCLPFAGSFVLVSIAKMVYLLAINAASFTVLSKILWSKEATSWMYVDGFHKQ